MQLKSPVEQVHSSELLLDATASGLLSLRRHLNFFASIQCTELQNKLQKPVQLMAVEMPTRGLHIHSMISISGNHVVMLGMWVVS